METQYTTKDIDLKFEKITEKYESLETTKADKATVSKIITYGIAAVVSIFGCIGGLYILYYSGLSRLETSVAVLNTKVEILTNNVAGIKETLEEAEKVK